MRNSQKIVARLQALIKKERIGSALAVARHKSCPYSRSWVNEAVATGVLKLARGVPLTPMPPRLYTPKFIKEIQGIIDRDGVCSAHVLARHPQVIGRASMAGLYEAVDKGIIRLTPKRTAHEVLVDKLATQFSPKDLRHLADTGKVRVIPGAEPVPIVKFTGQRMRLACISDTHVGSRWFEPRLWEKAVKRINEEKPDLLTHSGDVTDGHGKQGHGKVLSNELTEVGFKAQKARAVECFAMIDRGIPIKMVDGNHDLWYLKDAGADIVEEIAAELRGMKRDVQKIGSHWGDISLNGKATARLWHGEDGNSYAVSYRIQKLVEAMQGGSKPNVLLAGHTHKALYLPERNVHCYSVGSIQLQTSWMMGKRIAAHAGFWIIDLWINAQGISRASGTFYPFYQ